MHTSATRTMSGNASFSALKPVQTGPFASQALVPSASLWSGMPNRIRERTPALYALRASSTRLSTESCATPGMEAMGLRTPRPDTANSGSMKSLGDSYQGRQPVLQLDVRGDPEQAHPGSSALRLRSPLVVGDRAGARRDGEPRRDARRRPAEKPDGEIGAVRPDPGPLRIALELPSFDLGPGHQLFVEQRGGPAEEATQQLHLVRPELRSRAAVHADRAQRGLPGDEKPDGDGRGHLDRDLFRLLGLGEHRCREGEAEDRSA